MKRTTKLFCIIGFVALLLPAVAPSRALASPQQQPKEVKGGLDAMRKGKYDEAIERFREALVEAPASEDARLGLALAFLKTRKFYSSIEQSAKVLEKTPLHPRANAIVGMVLMRVGALLEATGYFKRALEANDRESLALAGLGEMYLYAGDLREALRHARLAVAHSPRDPDFQYLLAQCSARQELYEEAATAYTNYLHYASDLDGDRRDRIHGLVKFYKRLVGRSLYVYSGATTDEIPMTIAESRLPFIDVMVNGKGPFRFCLDSGAGFVVISKKLSDKLGIRPIASGGTSRGVSGDGRFEIVYGVIDRLGLGAVTLDNVPTYIREIHESERETIDGYIGLSVLGRFRSAIDFTNNVLELRARDSEARPLGPNDVEVPFRTTNGGMLSVRADIGKETPLNFIVDTGASSTVVSENAFARYNLREKQHHGVSVRVVGAGGVTEAAPVVVLDHVAIDGLSERRDFVRAVVLDLDPVNEAAGFEQAGIIGTDILRFYRIEFDFNRGIIVFSPSATRGGATATLADVGGVS